MHSFAMILHSLLVPNGIAHSQNARPTAPAAKRQIIPTDPAASTAPPAGIWLGEAEPDGPGKPNDVEALGKDGAGRGVYPGLESELVYPYEPPADDE